MGLKRIVKWVSALLMAGGVAVTAAEAGSTRTTSITISVADPSIHGDGTMSPAARRAMLYGALPMSPRTAILKAAKDRALAARGTAAEPNARGPRAPAIVGGHNFAGQIADTPNTNNSPPDPTGAIGRTRYIQTVNTAVRIVNRSTHATIAQGSLNQLANLSSSVFSFDPQVIWDPTTNRFYYAMDSIVSASDHRIAFGFSKTASPANLSSDWCHYTVDDYGTFFPDYPKLGDSRYFILIGVNVFDPDFYDGSDIIAIRKPPAGQTCPTAGSLKRGIKKQLKDTGGFDVFTPVPSNQIDNNATGYVVGTSGPGASKLWFFNVTKSGTGAPVFGAARGVTVPTYNSPNHVPQTNGWVIDSSDTRNTQAVQAINPGRGTGSNIHSFWTQHTVDGPGVFSVVKWYEINPAPATPVVLRSGIVQASNAWAFNGAISPDRKVNGTAKAFGDSFVIQYNAASTTLDPRIVVRSSLHGGAVSGPFLIKGGVDQYQDFTCGTDPFEPTKCRWGDYAAATPDPAPGTTGAGVVWSTNQFSGVNNPPIANGNWRTQIFAVKP